jgi:hypothetical protein
MFIRASSSAGMVGRQPPTSQRRPGCTSPGSSHLADHGLKAWQQVLEHGYEGLVAKDPESRYVGGRTLKWLKVKQPNYREGERGWEPKGKS